MDLPDTITPGISVLEKLIVDSAQYTASGVLNTCAIAVLLNGH